MKILEYSWIRIRARCRESQDPPAFVDGFGVKTRNSTENSALYVSCQAKVVMCCSSCMLVGRLCTWLGGWFAAWCRACYGAR